MVEPSVGGQFTIPCYFTHEVNTTTGIESSNATMIHMLISSSGLMMSMGATD